ncbi:hypothetical protein KAU08_07240, partial [bacterium]|nr:hypothetical protein [bacterium]
SGMLRILDSDCEAEESDVIVGLRFGKAQGKFQGKSYPMHLAGTRSPHDDGTYYSGDSFWEIETDYFTRQVTKTWELLTTPDPDNDAEIIDGWYERTLYFSFTIEDHEWEIERTWLIEIDGTELDD